MGCDNEVKKNMKKLLLLACLLASFASFAVGGPDFPYDMNEIRNAQGYDANLIHGIQDRDRPAARDRDFGRHGWYVHNSNPYYYGGYPNGHVWYPNSHVYGPAPSAGLGGALVAGAVVGAATVACCCW